MFWNKTIIKEKAKICSVNNGLIECSSVENIREWQQEFKKIENINIRETIKKYFEIDHEDIFYRNINEVEHLVFYLIQKFDTKYSSFEERFKAFGNEIDEFIQRDKIIKELNRKISLEKDKLGIE